MSRNTSNQSHGADGNWFLEAVGAKPPTPKASESVAELERENAEDDTSDEAASTETDPTPVNTRVTAMSFDGDPGTSTSSFDPIPAPPPPPDLEDLPELSQDDTGEIDLPPPPDLPADAVDDTELSPALRSRRRFRWPVVVILVVLVGLVGAAAIYLPRAAKQTAADVGQDYYDASAGVRNYLPTAQTALDAVTNSNSSSQEVSSAVPLISELDSRAFALEAVTAEPLPDVLPLVPSGAIDDLVPLRDRGAILGASSSGVARGLGNAYVYRTSIPLLLDTGPLPAAATTQEVNEISVRLAASLASDSGIVADLPNDSSFVSVDAAAASALDRYATWQDEYLAALAGEDSDAAAALIAEMEVLRVDLNATNDSALLAYRTVADLGIVDLAGELEAYMTALTQG